MDTLEDIAYDQMYTDSAMRTYEAGVQLARLVAAEDTAEESLAKTAERVTLAWEILAADRDPLNSPLL
jgi:hypothetical protein